MAVYRAERAARTAGRYRGSLGREWVSSLCRRRWEHPGQAASPQYPLPSSLVLPPQVPAPISAGTTPAAAPALGPARSNLVSPELGPSRRSDPFDRSIDRSARDQPVVVYALDFVSCLRRGLASTQPFACLALPGGRDSMHLAARILRSRRMRVASGCRCVSAQGPSKRRRRSRPGVIRVGHGAARVSSELPPSLLGGGHLSAAGLEEDTGPDVQKSSPVGASTRSTRFSWE